MKITNKNIVEISLDSSIYNELEHIIEMLEEIENTIGDNVDLSSCDTQEIVSTKEFARVRGILSAFFENDGELWEIL